MRNGNLRRGRPRTGGAGAARAIILDGRYTHGLSRLAEDSDIHNRAVSLMLGYSFALPYGATPRAGGRMPGLPGGP